MDTPRASKRLRPVRHGRKDGLGGAGQGPAGVRCPTPLVTRGGPMNSGPAQRDVEIRAAIDELNEAEKTVRGVREEGERWQQENPSPKQPKSVQRMAEIEEFEGRNQAWNKLYMEHRERLEQAQARLHAAQEKARVTAPTAHRLRIQGKAISARAQFLSRR